MEKLVPVMAVKKAFDLLEILHLGMSSGREGMPLAEIARIMGMKANSARNILKTMIVCGYVEQTPSSKYLPGPKCRQMGVLNRALGKADEGSVNSVLEEMTGELGEASVFAVLVGGNRVIVGTVEANREIKINQATITSDSIFKTPTGRILAAYAEPEALLQIVERHGMPGEAWSGIETEAELKKALERIRKDGKCVSENPELTGIALPVFNRGGSFAGAIGCYAPSFRCPEAKKAEIVSKMKAYAAKIAKGLE